jgi:hypothetical protein
MASEIRAAWMVWMRSRIDRPALLELGQYFAHAEPLDNHAGEADQIGLGQAVEVQRLDIFVDQSDMQIRRSQGGQEQERGEGYIGFLIEGRQSVLHTPERRLEPRVDQYDLGHKSPPSRDDYGYSE